jgi:hypothetical protein
MGAQPRGPRQQHAPAYKRMCALLRAWRTEAELSQRGLAAKLKRPPSYVHKVEVADRRIDPIEFIAWCRACGVDSAAAIKEL